MWLALGCIGLAVAVMLDGVAYRAIGGDKNYDTDWMRLFRVAGYLPVWIVIAVVQMLHDKALRRGLMIFGGAALTGAAAEVIKVLVRRDRPPEPPVLWNGVHTYDWSQVHTLHDFFNAPHGHGLPSSHAAVAFGGAWILARLYPESKYIWLTLAALCGLSRMISHGHFLSDVYLSALVGYVVCQLISRGRKLV